jgi:cell fate regulator YaaT (PSP1 superfamily)
MSAIPDLLIRPDAADQFIVGFGKSGALGVFNAPAPLLLRRGDRVIVRTPRGIEVGSVLCPATVRQARLLGATASGALLRPLSDADAALLVAQQQLAQQVYAVARKQAQELDAEILDVEVFFDGRQAIVQFVGESSGLDDVAQILEHCFTLEVRLENLAQAVHDADHGGCGKPDCGRDAGGCSTCSTGGGCSSCGSSKVDLRPYFAHLREKMEQDQRRPLN